MAIEAGDWHDILKVLHETYRIWSPGLSKSDFQAYAFLQMNQRWARRNYRYFIYKRKGRVAASCKFYVVLMAARGKIYSLAAIGAVYTQEEFRNQGCATALINAVIDLARQEGLDGLLLYSEIGPEFYQQFGFEETGSCDFHIYLCPHNQEQNGDGQPIIESSPVTSADVPGIIRHHRRWLRGQSYGIYRTAEYLNYKLFRENFLHQNSQLCWPVLELSWLPDDSGYMITEQGGGTLRVLEIIGSESGRRILWQALLQSAQKSGAHRIRGWEGNVRDFAPGFSVASYLHCHATVNGAGSAIAYAERDWGVGMILPLNEAISPWVDAFPCPLLELDHV